MRFNYEILYTNNGQRSTLEIDGFVTTYLNRLTADMKDNT